MKSHNFIDLTGKRFGRWLVLKLAEPKENKQSRWLCKCDCGVERSVHGAGLRGGLSKSCGCLKRENSIKRATKHGMKGTRIYRIWKLMKQRCLDSNAVGYEDYGGRGIMVCDEWMDFINFYNDMKSGYKDNLQLDRKENDKGYSKENCRWVTPKVNSNNKRNNRLIEYLGITDTLTNHCKRHGIDFGVAKYRLNQGWSPEKTFTTPVRKFKKIKSKRPS